MSYLDKIVEIYTKEESDFIKSDSSEMLKTVALYLFYHYYNADVTTLDEINECFCCNDEELKKLSSITEIIAICHSKDNDKTIDFITSLPASVMTNITSLNIKEYFLSYLNTLSHKVGNIICNNKNPENARAIKLFQSFFVGEKSKYQIKILCNYPEKFDNKNWYQIKAEEYFKNNNKISIQVLFEDDILEEISDIESPKCYVDEGEFTLYNDSIAYFGNEKSFLGFLSAKSLKENFVLYSTKGLFASNLRYYVKSAKIDSQINKTLKEEPENFCYYNNGVIITCDDYKIIDDKLYLKNYSIVNGGQTTNLIGRSDFDNDFSVMCKIIKKKYNNIEDNVEFLAKVAEASNTQKPIKAKDLIANRKEQRLLKMQYEQANIFLQIKRGDKISKERYPEPWQNASNDNVAQMLYSIVYQCPGQAKNAKSKLLENDKIYNKIFKENYNSNFLVSIQHIKVGFSNWTKKVKKEEKFGSLKLGLAKNADLMTMATIGLIYKMDTDLILTEELNKVDLNSSIMDIDYLKLLCSQNDIGNFNFMNLDFIESIKKNSMFDLFNNIFEKILIPAYSLFVNKYPNYSYGNFVKSDLYYYSFVVPYVIKKKEAFKLYFKFDKIFDEQKKGKIKIPESKETPIILEGQTFEECLVKYNLKIKKKYKMNIWLSKIQMVNILQMKPKELKELRELIGLNEEQIKFIGDDLLSIVKEFTDINRLLK